MKQNQKESCGAKRHNSLFGFGVNCSYIRLFFTEVTCLIPKLQPNEWVIIDNATFHHGGRIRKLIEAAGCKLVYRQAYSPDLNRIEKCWAWLKHRIRKLLRNSDDLCDAMESVLAASAS